MQQRQDSGLSINAWCELNGVSRQKYFYWQRKVREIASQGLATREITAQKELQPVGWTRLETAQAESEVVVEINGCCVNVGVKTDPDLLAQVCRMLQSL